MSLLLAHGHVAARRYPLATVWYESQIIRERVNNQLVTESTLMHAMLGAVISPKDSARTNYKKLLKRLA